MTEVFQIKLKCVGAVSFISKSLESLSNITNKKRSFEQTYVADQSFEENKICLELLYPESQLILTHFTFLQILQNTHH